MRVQEFLHKYEVGAGAALVRWALVVMAVIGLGVIYDLSAFRNLSTQEGMDTAQLARNIGEGKGYTTGFIRPLSLHLLGQQSERTKAIATDGTNKVTMPLKHPDLANAPLYPTLLAGVLKLNPFGEPDLSKEPNFSIYLPDLWIALFNQALLAVAAWMVFRLAKRLFDGQVAWVATGVFLLTELLWRFTISGLSTILLMILFLALTGVVARIEAVSRDLSSSAGRIVRLSALAGIVVGIAAMTRYSFACLIIPVLILLLSLPRQQRALPAMAAVAAFLAATLPWIVRNFQVSGAPFGTAGFAIMELTSTMPGDELQRSLDPAVSQINTGEYWSKFIKNAREIVSNDMP